MNTALFSQRSLLTFMALTGIVNAYLMRLCLNLAMKLVDISNTESKNVSIETPSVFSSTKAFQWSKETNCLTKSAFLIGYALLHIPASFLAQKYGGKTIMNLGLLLAAVCTLLTPLTGQYGGANGLITLRFFMGTGVAPTYPALTYLLSCWIPEKERGTVSSIVFCGGQIGSMICNVLAEALEYPDGYATVCYTFGVLGLLWNIAFHFVVYNTPTTHPRINDEEREYLQNEVGELVETKTFFQIPWISMISSSAVMVLIIVQIGHDWGLYILVSEVPNYLKVVLRLQHAELAWYTSLSFIFSYLFSLICGVACDRIVSKKIVTLTQARKIFTAFGALVSASFTFLIYRAAFAKIASVVFYTLAMVSISAFCTGAQANFLDLCPNYSGALTGLVNGTVAACGFLAPYLTELLTTNGQYWEWEAVFCTSSVILSTTLLTYLAWGSAEVQLWNVGVDVDKWFDKGKSTLTFVSLTSWKSWMV